MRRNRIFWPLISIILGGLFLLDNLKILQISIWAIFFPILLILAGVSVLLGSLSRARQGETTSLSIPLDGTENAHLRVEYGAGRVRFSGGAASDELLSGTFEGGVAHDARRESGGLDVTLNSPFQAVTTPWGWDGGRREWDVRLNGNIPLALDFEVGAAESRIDLTDVRVTNLKLQTGASSTDLWLPAHAGQTSAKVSGGAASINIKVPAEVAARIQWSGGLAEINVDKGRFPRVGNAYQSPDYDKAKNKIDLKVEMGMGSVDIR
jgi:hypothetical protein